jgi:aminoglycoside 2''-phosphotransferase
LILLFLNIIKLGIGDVSVAEKVVKYVEYIKTDYPQLHVSNVKFNLTDGNHNDIVIINDEHIFKFAKYDWTVSFLANQIKTTAFISKYVDIHLPLMEYLDNGIAKCELIKGDPLFRSEILLMNESGQNYIAKQIGSFLRQLHAIPLKLARSNKLSEIPIDLSREAILSDYGNIKRKIYPYCDDYSQKLIEQNFAAVFDNKDFFKYTPAVIHAEPTPRRFIYDRESKKINGVIGFGCTGIGDPAYDLAVVLGSFGETFLKRISRYYGDMAKLIDRARFYSYYNQLSLAKKTADMITTRDFSNFKFDMQARDRMPIGSKW